MNGVLAQPGTGLGGNTLLHAKRLHCSSRGGLLEKRKNSENMSGGKHGFRRRGKGRDLCIRSANQLHDAAADDDDIHDNEDEGDRDGTSRGSTGRPAKAPQHISSIARESSHHARLQ